MPSKIGVTSDGDNSAAPGDVGETKAAADSIIAASKAKESKAPDDPRPVDAGTSAIIDGEKGVNNDGGSVGKADPQKDEDGAAPGEGSSPSSKKRKAGEDGGPQVSSKEGEGDASMEGGGESADEEDQRRGRKIPRVQSTPDGQLANETKAKKNTTAAKSDKENSSRQQQQQAEAQQQVQAQMQMQNQQIAQFLAMRQHQGQQQQYQQQMYQQQMQMQQQNAQQMQQQNAKVQMLFQQQAMAQMMLQRNAVQMAMMQQQQNAAQVMMLQQQRMAQAATAARASTAYQQAASGLTARQKAARRDVLAAEARGDEKSERRRLALALPAGDEKLGLAFQDDVGRGLAELKRVAVDSHLLGQIPAELRSGGWYVDSLTSPAIGGTVYPKDAAECVALISKVRSASRERDEERKKCGEEEGGKEKEKMAGEEEGDKEEEKNDGEKEQEDGQESREEKRKDDEEAGEKTKKDDEEKESMEKDPLEGRLKLEMVLLRPSAGSAKQGGQDAQPTTVRTGGANRGTATDEDREWEEHYLVLLNHSERHGNFNVRSAANPKLSEWIVDQRMQKVTGALKPERLLKLEQIGFFGPPSEVSRKKKASPQVHDPFALPPAANNEGEKKSGYNSYKEWQLMFNLLIQYKMQNGNFNVPIRKHPQLGAWVREQREKYSQGKLTPARTAQLNQWQFNWVDKRILAAQKSKAKKKKKQKGGLPAPSWDERHEALVRFTDRCGFFPASGDLHGWLEEQCAKMDQLSVARIQKLRDLGCALTPASVKKLADAGINVEGVDVAVDEDDDDEDGLIAGPGMSPTRGRLAAKMFWQSKEAAKLFGFEQGQDVRKGIQDKIVLLRKANESANGWKELIPNDGKDEIYSQNDIMVLRQKSQYLIKAYILALR